MIGPTITFTPDTKVTQKKEVFVSNTNNKGQFWTTLSESLCQNRCETHHSDGDADLLIVTIAVQSARTQTTVPTGDDTDLLILPLFHADANAHDLYLIPRAKSNSLKHRVWNIKILGTKICCKCCLFTHYWDVTPLLVCMGLGSTHLNSGRMRKCFRPLQQKKKL